MNPWLWARQSVKHRGLLRTSKVAWSVVQDLEFDLRYGTQTRHRVNLANLAIESENKDHAELYQATKSRPLQTLLRKLDLPRDCGFVDFGSGKGRALLIAAQYGFRKVLGIEFSPELCEVARANIELFAKTTPLRGRIEIVLADASQHGVGPDESVFYLYNPFDAHVLTLVLENIRASLQKAPRQVWLIYNTPSYRNVIEQSELFRSCSHHEIGGGEFRVYAG